MLTESIAEHSGRFAHIWFIAQFTADHVDDVICNACSCAGFICLPLMLIWVVVSMDLHVAQFFFPHGFVCPCLLPKAMLLVLTNGLRRLLPGLLINWKKLSFLDFSTGMQSIFWASSDHGSF